TGDRALRPARLRRAFQRRRICRHRFDRAAALSGGAYDHGPVPGQAPIGAAAMSLSVRRVVTGHDQSARAIVQIDEIARNDVQGRPGAHAANIWTTEAFPVDNDGDSDAATRKVGTTLDNGTVFRVVSFGPGVAARNHRTDSIDYATVISGEIDMEL